MITNLIKKATRSIRNTYGTIKRGWEHGATYETLPPEIIRAATSVKFVKEALIKFSMEEYDRNPYYNLVIENLTNHTVGPAPAIIANSDRVEDLSLIHISEPTRPY